MPLYDLRCENGHLTERMIPLEKFSEPIFCSCGAPASRVISAPMFSVEQVGYDCPITGDWIGSKKAHEENLRKHNCRVLEEGETREVTATRARQEADFDRKIEETVEREIATMPSAKQEQLHNELVNGGLTAEAVRL